MLKKMATELDDILIRAFDGDDEPQQKMPSPDEQRDFIKQNIEKCSRDDLISIFRAIVIDGDSCLIRRQQGQSSAVNLDKVRDETIKVMYLKMNVILDRNNSLVGI